MTWPCVRATGFYGAGWALDAPACTVLNQSPVALIRLAGEVGLTPAGRDRLDWSVGSLEEEEDELKNQHA